MPANPPALPILPPRNGCLYMYLVYIFDLDNNSLMRKMLRRRELFPAVEGGAETVLTATLRKGHRDLPILR